MKKFICALCLSGLVLSGCTQTTQEKIVLPALEPDHYLYEVKDKEGHHLYLLGTMHVGPELVDIDGNLKKAYDDSSTIAFEIKMIPTQEQIQAMNQALMEYPLNDIQNENFDVIWEDFDDAYKKVNDSFKAYNAMYAVTTANNELYDEVGVCAEYGVDMRLFKQAQEDHKNIKEIEGYDLQIDVIKRMGQKAPMLMLVSMIDKDIQKQAIESMVKSYSSGSLDASVFDEDTIDENDLPKKYRTGTFQQEFKDYQDILVSSRNDDMLEKAIGYLKNNDTLLAVGAGHVVGETGLVQQFKDAGYIVKKVE